MKKESKGGGKGGGRRKGKRRRDLRARISFPSPQARGVQVKNVLAWSKEEEIQTGISSSCTKGGRGDCEFHPAFHRKKEKIQVRVCASLIPKDIGKFRCGFLKFSLEFLFFQLRRDGEFQVSLAFLLRKEKGGCASKFSVPSLAPSLSLSPSPFFLPSFSLLSSLSFSLPSSSFSFSPPFPPRTSLFFLFLLFFNFESGRPREICLVSRLPQATLGRFRK